jgi:hypothetical protein
MSFLFDPIALEASEMNRLFTMISDRNGRLSRHHASQLQQYFECVPSPPPPRIGTAPEVPSDRVAPRSRLVDQFYAHHLAGIRHSAFTDIRTLIERQIAIQREARTGTELLTFAMKNLTEAFPEVPQVGYSAAPSHHSSVGEDSSRITKIPQCPTKYMEASIATVLEHTEHLTVNLQRIDEEHPKAEESQTKEVDGKVND